MADSSLVRLNLCSAAYRDGRRSGSVLGYRFSVKAIVKICSTTSANSQRTGFVAATGTGPYARFGRLGKSRPANRVRNPSSNLTAKCDDHARLHV